MIPLKDKVKAILKSRKIPLTRFAEETQIDRVNFFYRDMHRHCRYIHMAIAYYLGMDVEELVSGTDAEFDWYGDCGE